MSSAKEDQRELGVSEFKRRCLELCEWVHRNGKDLVITKHGRAIARVIPLHAAHRPLRGTLRGRIEIVGDIVGVDWSEDWEVLR